MKSPILDAKEQNKEVLTQDKTMGWDVVEPLRRKPRVQESICPSGSNDRPPIPFCQVHLDFHTSEHLLQIGEQFDRRSFQQQLKNGHVESMTLFAKCHHGWFYYPSTVGVMHPHLKFNLLQEQITACQEIGVKTPLYLSAGLDERYLRLYPEQAGKLFGASDEQAVGFKRICFNTPYVDAFCLEIRDVLKHFDCQGLFFDIVGVFPCVCPRCTAEMRAAGLDPTQLKDVVAFGTKIQRSFFDRVGRVIREFGSHIGVYHNAGHVNRGDRDFLKYVSHLELESLPTGGWGYDHFPVSAKYAASLGMEFLGMTGKFHTAWGEFGGFKHKNALLYETSAILAYGGKCSIGDQLHPSGALNEDTYRLIGSAYKEVAKKTPYCRNVVSAAEVALLSTESLYVKMGKFMPQFSASDAAKLDSDTGAARMLLERHIQFDVIDAESDFHPYKLIILPDKQCLDAATAAKLRTFAAAGGKVIASYKSIFEHDSDRMVFEIGAYKGQSGFNPEYIQISDVLYKKDATGNLIKSPFVIHSDAVNLAVDGEVLAQTRHPYFNRTREHFCSHQHTPEGDLSRYPAVVRAGNILYFAHELFEAYAKYGQMLYRDMFYTAADDFIGGFNVKTSLPSFGRISFVRQPDQNRYVLHLLCASPIKRGGLAFSHWGIRDVEVIEDILPVAEINCQVRVKKAVQRVVLPLKSESLPFTQQGEWVRFVVPSMWCHEIITLDYNA